MTKPWEWSEKELNQRGPHVMSREWWTVKFIRTWGRPPSKKELKYEAPQQPLSGGK